LGFKRKKEKKIKIPRRTEWDGSGIVMYKLAVLVTWVTCDETKKKRD